jgi:hypothetical protein
VPVQVTIGVAGADATGATRYVVHLQCLNEGRGCNSVDLPELSTPYGPPTLHAQDVTGDGVPELLVSYGVGTDAAVLAIYQARGGTWARIMEVSGHPFVAPVPGGQSFDVLSSVCCPPQGWGYTWISQHDFVPLPADQIVAAFHSVGRDFPGLEPTPALAVAQAVQVVAGT